MPGMGPITVGPDTAHGEGRYELVERRGPRSNPECAMAVFRRLRLLGNAHFQRFVASFHFSVISNSETARCRRHPSRRWCLLALLLTGLRATHDRPNLECPHAHADCRSRNALPSGPLPCFYDINSLHPSERPSQTSVPSFCGVKSLYACPTARSPLLAFTYSSRSHLFNTTLIQLEQCRSV
jgi:hypothetical protein